MIDFIGLKKLRCRKRLVRLCEEHGVLLVSLRDVPLKLTVLDPERFPELDALSQAFGEEVGLPCYPVKSTRTEAYGLWFPSLSSVVEVWHA